MTVRLERICRYPVKGLTAEELGEVDLEAGRVLAGDRRFAIARGTARIDASAPQWAPKTRFFTLMSEDRLAALTARYEPETGQLAILRGGRPVIRAKVTESTGRTVASQFFAAYLDEAGPGAPRLIDAGDTAMTDSPEPLLSLINLASVRDMTRVVGQPLDPLRFRANLYFDGAPAWQEWNWIGHTLTIGETSLEVVGAIDRCAATTVNPRTAERDVNVPRALMRGYGHVSMGVYLRVARGGRIARGDEIAVPAG